MQGASSTYRTKYIFSRYVLCMKLVWTLNVDFSQFCKSQHVFWDDPVGSFIEYLRQSRPFADKIFVLFYNSWRYDAQFLQRRFMELKWTPKLFTDWCKILYISTEHFHILDFLNVIPVAVKDTPKSFSLPSKSGYYPYFNTMENLNYERPIPWSVILWSRLHVEGGTGTFFGPAATSFNSWISVYCGFNHKNVIHSSFIFHKICLKSSSFLLLK
jgi:hypothetical protein